MKKLISLLIAVLMVFGLLPVLSAPATHASADSSDGYGDSKSASHPADTLRGFSYFYHDSKYAPKPRAVAAKLSTVQPVKVRPPASKLMLARMGR